MKKNLLAVILLGANFFTAYSQIPVLSSYPSSPYVVYLNFGGETVNNANWYSTPIVAAAPVLTTAQIADIFNRVAEKYRPFNINITTDTNVYNAAEPSKRVHAVITPTSTWYGSAGGVAYVGCFGYTVYDPAWIFSDNLANTPEYIADAVTHEVGHTLGLYHHGQFNSSCVILSNYNQGKGAGQTSWGPIMGAPYGMNMVLWYKGTMTTDTCDQSNEDDLEIITTSNGFTYRANTKGTTIGTASSLNIVSNVFSDSGIIKQSTEIDMFKIPLTETSSVTIKARPYSTDTTTNEGADLDIALTVYNSSSQQIAIDTPSSVLNAGITLANLPPGNYYFSITSKGNANFTDYGGTGPLNYGSIGTYYINGTISPDANALPPVVAFSTPSTTPCAGQSVAFTDKSINNPTSWSWQCTGATPSIATAQNPDFSFAAGGTYSMKLIVSNAFGSDSLTQQVTINSNPTLTLTPNLSICNGSTTSLTAGGATTYSWSPSSGLNVTAGTSVSANPVATTTYTITGTTSGCNATNTVVVTVNATPVLTINPNTSVCDGNPATLTVSGASTYTWSPDTTLDNDTTATVIASPSVNTTYTVTGTGTNGCSSSKTVVVTVNATPSVTVSSDAAICSGTNTNLTAGGATTYTWAPAAGLNNTSASNVTATPSSTTTYTVTGANGGCSATNTVVVTVNGIPVLTTSSNTSICNGTSANLTVSGASTYSWSPSSSLDNTSTGSVNATPSVNTTYTVTGTGGNGCTANGTIEVTVNAIPNPVISGNSTICSGSNTALTASGASTYSWSPSTGLSNSNTSAVTANPVTATTYTVTGTTNGCSGNNTITITVNPLPNLTTSGNAAICSGNNSTLTVSGASTYSWAPATGLNATTTSTVTASPTAPTTYTVTGTSNGCSAANQIILTVNALPALNTSPNTSVCNGNPADLTAVGASTYSWAPSSSLSNSTESAVVATPSSNTTYTVTGTGSNGCSTSKTITVTVGALPGLTASSDATVCSGANTVLTAGGASAYTWAPATGLNNTTAASVTTTPSSNITYTVTGTSNGCSSSAQITVTINAIPILTLSPNTAICNGGSTSLTASGATTYSWSPTTGLNTTTAASATANPTTTTTYTVTGTTNGCSGTKTVAVTVNAIPVLNLTSNTSICDGSSTPLTVSGASTYSWSPATGLSTTSAASATANPTTATTYTVTGTTNGCSGTKTVAVTVNAIPVLALTPNTSICDGSSTALTVSGASTYSWSPATGLNSTSTASATANPITTTTYTVTGTANGCSGTKTVAITVNTLPTLTLTPTTSVCNGSSTDLTVSGASTYSWSPASSLNSSTGGSVTASPSSNTVYTVIGTASNSCSSSKTVAVTVNALPGLTVSANATICSGANTTLTVSGASTYTWLPVTGLNNTTAASVTATPASTITYTVTGTSNGCSSSKPIAITVNATPVITASANASICDGSSTPLTVSGATSYSWSPSSGLNSTSSASITANPNITTSYTVTGTTTGCSGSKTVVVTVNALPVLTLTPNTAICDGSSTTLTTSGATTYSWSPSTGLNNTSAASVTANPASTITYTVTGTKNGCNASKPVTITVNAVPVLALSPAASICDGGSTNLTVSGATTYSWSPTSGLSNASSASITANPTTTTTYTATGTSNSCSASKTVVITVNALPILTHSSNTTICDGNSATLTAGGATSYSWSPATGLNSTSATSVTANPLTTTTYTITGTGSDGCSVSATTTLTVNANPVITVSSAATVCSGSSAALTATGASSYVWAPSVSLNSGSGSSVSATPVVNTTYTITGTTNGCTDSKTITVNVKATPQITYNVTNPTCASSSNGAINVTVTGVDSLSYLWSDGKTTQDISGIAEGPYTVTVSASDGCSSSANVAVQANSCGIPTTLSATNITAVDAVAHWKQIVCSFGYKIRSRPTDNNNWTYFVLPASDSSMTIPNLSSGTLYYWQIESFCNSQNTDSSGYSAAQSFTTDNACTVPSTPSVINITESTGIVVWQTISSAEQYQLRYQKTSIDSEWIQSNAPDGKLMDTLKALAPATQYMVQVRSVCDTTIGEASGWSASKIFVTPINDYTYLDGVMVQDNSVVIYPNPASDLIRVEASFNTSGDVEISIIDVTGRELNSLIYTSPDGSLSKDMDISSLASGLYFLRLVKDGETVTKRIVKQQ